MDSTSVVFLSKPHNSRLTIIKTAKVKLRDILQKTWPANLKIVKAIKKLIRVKHCHSSENSKETDN